MTATTFPRLRDVEGKLQAKQAELAGIFREAGPDRDFDLVKSVDGDTAAKVAHVQALNDEMTKLAKEAAGLRSIRDIADALPDDEKAADSGSAPDADSDRKAAPMTFGDAFFKAGANVRGQEREIDFDVKTTFATSAGWAPFSQRLDKVVPLATRTQFTLLDFIPTAPTNASSIDYFEETTFTNAAVEVTEGAAKPEATLALTLRSATVRKIAVYIPVTDEQLDDVPGAKAYLNQRLGFMVRQRLSGQIISGDGSAPNVRGVLNVAGIQTQAKGADPTPDAVYKAMTKIRVTGQAEPDAVVFHPTDWQDVRLLRTADGLYIWGNPSEAGPEMIWGLNVLLDQAMTADTAVVGAWQQYSLLYVRQGLVVETGYNADDFTKNKQTVRAEMRAVPVFFRPAAFCSVTGV